MSAEHRICWVLVCDTCRAELQDPNEDTVPHFDTIDAATDHALGLGWQFDTDGHTYCHRCVAIATCRTVGHDFTPWLPCICQGAHPDHALWGCGLLRFLPAPRLRHRRVSDSRVPSDDRRTHHTRPLTATATSRPTHKRWGWW